MKNDGRQELTAIKMCDKKLIDGLKQESKKVLNDAEKLLDVVLENVAARKKLQALLGSGVAETATDDVKMD